MTILAGFLNISTAVLGYQRISWLNRITVPLLSILCLWMTFKLFSLTSMSNAIQYQPNGSLSYGEGMDMIIGGFLSGAFVASDFSRYARSDLHNWLGTLPGTFFVSFLLGLVGMLAVAATGDWNPVLVVQDFGMGLPALIFILLANWTTNHSVLYSSGLALTSILPQLGRWKNTFFCGVAGIILAVAGLTDFLQQWLILLSVMLSPLLGVVLTDFFIIKRTLQTKANIQAIFSVITGIILAKITPPEYISSAVGLVSSSIIYFILMRMKNRLFSTKKAPRRFFFRHLKQPMHDLEHI
jgi:cytosine permease